MCNNNEVEILTSVLLAVMMECILKCGFCKKLLLYECNSDQLPTFFILSSLLGGCNTKATANPPKNDDRMKKRQLVRVAFMKK